MFYTIYKTTNNINGKYYIGKHKTNDLDDKYLGSGKLLKRAIRKYGADNFTKEYLFIFDNEDDMNNKEAELICAEFIKEDTNYNLKLGGEGGWDHLNVPSNISQKSEAGKAAQQIYKDNPVLDEKRRELARNRMRGNTFSKEWRKQNPNHKPFYGKKHTKETKKKLSKPKNIGTDNPSYGTMWIYSIELGQNKKINKNDPIPEGWYKGRKMKFK